MKTILGIFVFFIAAVCSAQSPTTFPHPFTFTPPDSGVVAEMRALEKKYPPIIRLKTAYTRVKPDSAMSLARFIAVYDKVNFFFDDAEFDVNEKTLIYYHENGWHNPPPDKINPADDSDIKYADTLFIYADRETGELFFDYKKEDRSSALPLKLITQFLE
jgi:hypothetical protein